MSNGASQQVPSERTSRERDDELVPSETESERPWSDRVLNFSETPLQRSEQTIGRIALSMFVVGIGVGLTCLLTWYWIEAAVLPEQGGTEAQIIEGYTPLAFLAIAAVSAPIVASAIGLLESHRVSAREDIAVVGIGCLVGAVLLVFVAGAFIGATGGETEGGPGPLDLVGLAGLAGLVSAMIASLLSALNGN